MKKLYYIALCALCSFVAVGCEDFDPDSIETPNQENEITIYATGGEPTRAYVGQVGADGQPSKIVWDAGDKVGIYLAGPATETNACFTSASGKGAAEATFRGSFEYTATTGNFTYYAYSPYTATAGTDYTAVAGYLSPAQIQTTSDGSHIGKQMLEIADPVTSGDNKGNIKMTFRNKFAVLNFKIKYGTRSEDAVLKGAKVIGMRVYIANPRNSDDDPFIPLYTKEFRLAGAYSANLATADVTYRNDSYAWIIDLQMNQENAIVNSTTTEGALDAWIAVNPVADLTDKKLVAEITTDKGIFITSRSIKDKKLEANTVYVMPATIKVPKVTPQVYPLWTDEANFFDSGVTKYNEDESLALGSAIELKPSNCFVVKPNTLYKFKANVRGRGAAGVAAMGITNGTQIVGDYAINSDGTISSVMDDKDYIYFRTTTTGNGVLSLYFGGTVLWSWHVWSINNELTDVQVADNVYMLDRNLGARSVLTTDLVNAAGTFEVSTAGLYYCWGFNVPYPGIYGYVHARSTPYTSSAINKYLNDYYYEGNFDGKNVTTRYIVPALTLSTSIMSPYAPADLASNTEINTETDEYLRMWGYSSDGNYKKTAFDPCPYGYMVPKQEVFGQYNIDTEHGFNIDEEGVSPLLYKSQVHQLMYNGKAATYLPEMGVIGLYNTDASPLNWRHQGQGMAYYWTATPASTTKNGGVMTATSYNPDSGAFGSTYSNEENNRRAMIQFFTSTSTSSKHFHYALSRFQGCPVRCVKCSDEQ